MREERGAMMKNMKALVMVSAIVVTVGVAGAGVVFEQLPAGGSGHQSDSSGSQSNERVANLFRIGSDAEIGVVEFWGTYINGQLPDSFTINFYSAVGGSIDTLLSSETVGAVSVNPTGNFMAGNRSEYHYIADLSTSFSALADVDYSISITNDTNSGASNSWLWELSSVQGPGSSQRSYDSGLSWSQGGGFGLAFRLGSVPSPSSVALLGLAGVAGMRRRR